MSVIDIIIVVVFVGAIAYGLYKGLIAQLGSLGGVVLGVIACRVWGEEVSRWVGTILPDMASSSHTAAYVNTVIGNVALFLAVFLLTVLIAKLLKSLTNALSLGVFDRLLGAIFGLLKWFLVFSMLLNLWDVLFPGSSLIKSSEIAGGLAIKAILDLAPTLFGSVVSM